MSLTYSPDQLDIDYCPNFNLTSVQENKVVQLSDFQGAPSLTVMFICGHCPYVVAIEDRLIELARELEPQKARFVGICSNDANDYPEDSPAALKVRAEEKSYSFPYLIDDTQDVARSFGAVCTPDLFVFGRENENGKRPLVYRGRLDDSWKDPSAVKNRELKLVIESIHKDTPPPFEPRPSMGCSIKWKNSR